MNRNYRLPASGRAILVLGVLSLALAGCGRKGGLDLPPNAMNSSSAAPVEPDSEAQRAAQPGVFNPNYGSDGVVAPKGQRKSFILDPLLGN